MRRKVIHIVEDLHTGGLEVLLRNLVLHLDRTRFDPEVWCLARGGEIADQLLGAGMRVRVFGMAPRPSFLWVCRLASDVRRSGAHILHCHSYTGCTVGRAAGILARTPLLLAHVHTPPTWLTARQRGMERMLAWFTGTIICVSDSIRRFLLATEGISPGKLQVVYNGAPDLCLPERSAARASFDIPSDSVVLGCVARLRPEKGHAILLQAAAHAARHIPNFRLLLVGDGPLRSQLEGDARRLPIATVFTGTLQHVNHALAAMDALALLSPEREGLSVALIEALAASLPVIGSRTGGIPEVVTDGVNGFLCEPGNIADAAERIERLFRDPNMMGRMGEAGRETYLKKFQLSTMVGQIERLYDR